MKLATFLTLCIAIFCTLFVAAIWQNGIVMGEKITAIQLYQAEKAEREQCQYGKRIK